MKWHEVIGRIQANAERAGFACMEFATWLVRSVIALIKKLFSDEDSGRGEGYLKGFPKQ